MKKQSKAKKIVSLYIKGLNPTEIAQDAGCTRSYAYKIIAAYNKNLLTSKQLDLPLEAPAPITGSPHPDMVNHPPHYTAGGIETIDFIEAKCLDYNLGNVVKYITRAGLKNSKAEDLKKARWYLDRAIAKLDDVQGVHQ